jgi:hypothetical protein
MKPASITKTSCTATHNDPIPGPPSSKRGMNEGKGRDSSRLSCSSQTAATIRSGTSLTGSIRRLPSVNLENLRIERSNPSEVDTWSRRSQIGIGRAIWSPSSVRVFPDLGFLFQVLHFGIVSWNRQVTNGGSARKMEVRKRLSRNGAKPQRVPRAMERWSRGRFPCGPCFPW